MHLANPELRSLFLVAFVAMGAFVAVYNYAGFRLAAYPFRLDQAKICLLFSVYLFGILSSSAAGAASDHFGHPRVMPDGFVIAVAGIALTFSEHTWIFILGVTLLTIGFFIVHSVASGWVGRLATRDKGHASSLYLLAYYLGSSVGGTAAGWFWRAEGWTGAVLLRSA